MSTFTVQPGARLLWSMRRRSSDVRCVLFAAAVPVEVRVLQDLDAVIVETFPDEWNALRWADAYGDRLRQHGWRHTPEDCSPSSAA